MMTPTDIEVKRFWSRVITGKNGHWFWNGKKNKRYKCGVYFISGKMYISRIVAWLLSGGAIPWKCFLQTTCGNDECINPKHIKLISQSDLMREKAKKYWDKKGRIPPEEKKKSRNIKCQEWKNKNREKYREYQRKYHQMWWKKNKSKNP